jgi:hypothetical protein
VCDIVSEGRFKSLNDINLKLQGQLSLVTYLRMNQAFVFWDKKLWTDVAGKSVNEFLSGFKKGSKPFRKILVKDTNDKWFGKGLLQAEKYCKSVIIDDQLGNVRIKHLLSWWDTNYFSHRLGEFLFKLTNNTLSVNHRVAHYNNNVNGACTLCTLNWKFPAPLETVTHLFYDCCVTTTFVDKFFREIIPEGVDWELNRKKTFWFTGFHEQEMQQDTSNLFLQAIMANTLFYIWECKIKKSDLFWINYKGFLLDTIKGMLAFNAALRDSKQVLNFNVCRWWP